MADQQGGRVIVEQGMAKSPLASKTIHFNIISALLVPAIWPFFPRWFTERPGAVDAVSAYFALGNIAMRFLTRKMISFKWRKFWTVKDENTEVKVATSDPDSPPPNKL